LNILKTLKSRYPKELIKKIVNASNDKPIQVTASDQAKAVPGDHEQCAFYWAGRRLFPNAKIFVSRSLMYVIENGVATRYQFGHREMQSIENNDSGKVAAKGKYWLKAYTPKGRDSLSQKAIILQRLRKAADEGCSKIELQKEFSQTAPRISELQDEGYKIVSKYLPGNNTVHYFLLSEPRKPVKSVRHKPALKRRYRKTETDELKRIHLWAV